MPATDVQLRVNGQFSRRAASESCCSSELIGTVGVGVGLLGGRGPVGPILMLNYLRSHWDHTASYFSRRSEKPAKGQDAEFAALPELSRKRPGSGAGHFQKASASHNLMPCLFAQSWGAEWGLGAGCSIVGVELDSNSHS